LRDLLYTRMFAIFIIIMWIITYVLGYMFNDPNVFVWWMAGIAAISIAGGVWYTYLMIKIYSERTKGEGGL